MTRWNVVIAILTGVLIALGATTAISWVAKEEVARDRRDISNSLLHQCAATRTAAQVAREALIEQKESNAKILPKIEFPGLTHKELIELSETKAHKESERILKLDAVATENCKGE